MEKTIRIDDKDVKFKSTAATPRIYRQNTGRDLFVDIQTLQAASDENINSTIFEDLAYTMAKQADPTLPDTALEWLDSFGMFSIYMILPEIIELWQLSSLSTADVRKNA